MLVKNWKCWLKIKKFGQIIANRPPRSYITYCCFKYLYCRFGLYRRPGVKSWNLLGAPADFQTDFSSLTRSVRSGQYKILDRLLGVKIIFSLPAWNIVKLFTPFAFLTPTREWRNSQHMSKYFFLQFRLPQYHFCLLHYIYCK